MTGHDGGTLFANLARIRPHYARKALLLTSGTHGIAG